MRNFFRTKPTLENLPVFSPRERATNKALLYAGGDPSHRIAMHALEQGNLRIAHERAHRAAVLAGVVVELSSRRQQSAKIPGETAAQIAQ